MLIVIETTTRTQNFGIRATSCKLVAQLSPASSSWGKQAATASVPSMAIAIPTQTAVGP